MLNVVFILFALCFLDAKKSFGSDDFSFAFTLGRSNSLYNKEDGSEKSFIDSALSASYKLSPSFFLAALAEGSQDLKDDSKSDISSFQLSLNKGLFPIKNEVLSLSSSLKFGVPVSKAQNSASFLGSLGVGLKADMNPEILFSRKFLLSGHLSGGRNFHQYETAKSGRVNSQYSSVQGFDVGWSFTDMVSFQFSANHYNSWGYQGFLKEFYNHSEEFSFQLGSITSFVFGHSLGSPYVSVYKANGLDSNYALVDEDNSFIYASITSKL